MTARSQIRVDLFAEQVFGNASICIINSTPDDSIGGNGISPRHQGTMRELTEDRIARDG